MEEGSWQDLRKAVEGSVFGNKRRKGSLGKGEEEVWIFGRPEGIDEVCWCERIWV